MKTRIVRWKAVIPLVLFLGLVIGTWMLLLDGLVRRSIEGVGTAMVGAKVDLAEADVRLRDGSVRLRGLQVTNPDAPMTNLVQIDEMVADLRMSLLLEKKVFVDTVAVRGMRFGTARATSGAIERPASNDHSVVRERVAAWADRVPIPDFSLDGLTETVDVAALQPDSLRTLQAVRNIRGAVGDARGTLERRLDSINPVPVIDSGRALAERLQGASIRSLGIRGVAQTVQSLRSTVSGVDRVRAGLASFEQTITGEFDAVRNQLGSLDDLRRQDLASARDLLQIPSLEAPDISPALFGPLALQRIQPILYWARMVERYIPPGLDPRRRPGPTRVRDPGTTVTFPSARSRYAGATIAFAEADVELDSTASAGGRYTVLVRDLSTAPSVWGRPVRINAARAGGAGGPDAIRFAAVLDHTTESIRDSVDVRLTGLALPGVTLPGIGVGLDLGRGINQVSLVRTGDSLDGRLVLRTSDVTWTRPAERGGRVADILWRAVSALNEVEVEVRIAGSIDGPRLAIRSNVASAISTGLQTQLRAEIANAEQRLRREVNRLVEQPIADARAQLTSAEDTIRSLTQNHITSLDQVKAELEARLRSLTGGVD